MKTTQNMKYEKSSEMKLLSVEAELGQGEELGGDCGQSVPGRIVTVITALMVQSTT